MEQLHYKLDSLMTPSMVLGPNDPSPFTVYNRHGKSPILFLCEHAGKDVPAAFHNLGLSEDELDRHFSWDKGAGEITRALADRFDAMALMGTYSRTVVDLHRPLNHPVATKDSRHGTQEFEGGIRILPDGMMIMPDGTQIPGLIPRVCEGLEIPGNKNLSQQEVEARIDAIARPYHTAIAETVHAMLEHGRVPVVITVHSFTPFFNNKHRPWHVGILWNKDERLSAPVFKGLAQYENIIVGDNEPYSRHILPMPCNVDIYAESAGLPNLMFEIRRDLIEDAAGQAEWAKILGDVLDPVLGQRDLYQQIPTDM